MKILIVGDLYGDPGLKILDHYMTQIKSEYQPHLLIANAENTTHGRGLSLKHYKELMRLGFHMLTMGNHVWANKELATYIDDANVVRPINFLSAPGSGYKVITFNQLRILIINVLGRTFMNANMESPFTTINQVLKEVPHDMSILDIHAEATSEKVALAHYFDGRIDIIYGTHTHVQTADERQLPRGSFYITDIGMTGPLNGIIGVTKEIVIDRFLNGYSKSNEVAEGDIQLNAVLIDTQAKSIKRLHLELNYKE
jgi:2',3'-cyclic-nucleotide 2'-phosphodiesterase